MAESDPVFPFPLLTPVASFVSRDRMKIAIIREQIVGLVRRRCGFRGALVSASA